MNVIMISPGYPAEMAFFARGLAAAGASVIGIGDQPPSAVPHAAREALAHYQQVGSLAAGDAVAATVHDHERYSAARNLSNRPNDDVQPRGILEKFAPELEDQSSGHSRPAVSGASIITFMFCTAWPDAPFT